MLTAIKKIRHIKSCKRNAECATASNAAAQEDRPLHSPPPLRWSKDTDMRETPQQQEFPHKSQGTGPAYIDKMGAQSKRPIHNP